MDQKDQSTSTQSKSLFKSMPFKIVVFIVILIGVAILSFFVISKSPKSDTKKIASRSIKIPAAKQVSLPVSKPIKKIDVKKIPEKISVEKVVEKEMATANQSNEQSTKPVVKESLVVDAEIKKEELSEKKKSEESSDDPKPWELEPDQSKSNVVTEDTINKEERKRKLNGIKQLVIKGEYGIEISAGGPISEFRYFSLQSPPRLVIDLLGEWEKPKKIEVRIGSEFIEKIRVWKHDDKLRLVSDLKEDDLEFEIETVSSGLSVMMKRK